jgi:RimJ/RimL family protein N-acetyltransferase
MVHELQTNEIERIRPLYRALAHHVVIDSVIEGNTPGRVLVDDPNHPAVACLWNRMDAIMLAGTPHLGEFNRDLVRVIQLDWAVDARRRHIPFFHWYFWPLTWSCLLGEIFAPAALEEVGRVFCGWRKSQVDWQFSPPADGTIHDLDERLLGSTELANLDRVVGWILSFWHSVPSFASGGVGSCLLIDGEIVSWCLPVFAGGRRIELGVETAPAHRGRGYATLVAAACVERCLALGLQPVWQCDRSNHASTTVAQKVGFSPRFEYDILRLPLDQLDGSNLLPGNPS